MVDTASRAGNGLPRLQTLLKEELLLALLGYGGSLIEVQASSGAKASSQLASDLEWLTATDR